ncbi:unnamed protein product, partial [Mesorhabditis spiculigera]
MVTGPLRNHSNIGPISSGAVVLLLVSLVSLAAGAPQINAQKTTSLLVDEEPDPEHIGAQQAPRSINVITIQKEPAISGARVEALTTEHEPVFLGHTARGESIVVPDSLIQYSLYGFWLDEVLEIGFTTKTCIEPEYSFDREVFGYQSDKRITLHASFGSHDRELRLCVKHRPKDRVTKPEFDEVAEARTWISTLPAPRKYYFPFPVQVTILAVLLVLSGLFSGLNLGLMALTPQELSLIMKSGSKTERRYAETILPIRERGNLLLCTLLLGNVCVNSAISILLDDLSSGIVALIGSSAGIVIFGEIFPQSVCVKKGLAVGAHTIFLTRFFMVLTFPVAFPISKILDWLLGDEVVAYDRKRLMELIKMNAKDENGLPDELRIAVGAMEISDKTVSDVMTRIDDVFMLHNDTVLNTKAVAEILRMGYTRIPIYSGDRNNVVSLLFVKDLALLDPDDNFTIQMVTSYHKHPLRFVMEDTPLRIMLEEFKRGDYHLAMVQRVVEKDEKDPTYDLVGVVTLEDIVEEILQAEIVDETDAVTDNVFKHRRRGAQAMVPGPPGRSAIPASNVQQPALHQFQADVFKMFTTSPRLQSSLVLLEHATDLSYLCSNEEPSKLSVQMQLVTMQWLTTNHALAFSSEVIASPVLEKLIRQQVRRVELSHLPDMYDPKAVIPRTAKIFTKGEFSDRFVLILEGRALVTIGQDQMTFEAGPWHAFGTELLERLCDHVVAESKRPLNGSRCSLTDRPEQKDRKIGFTPDYSVVVRDDCTFLEISANHYELAYKTSQISKTTARISVGEGPTSNIIRGPLMTDRTGSQSSVSKGCSARDLDPVERVKRNGGGKIRSSSESEQTELLPRCDFLSPRDGSLFSEESGLSDA